MSDPVYSGQVAPRPKASSVAVWSLVLGILSITCLWILGSIPAIILGVMGMKKADVDPANVGGKGLSLAGLICGSVGIFTGIMPIAIVSSFALPGLQATRVSAYQAGEVGNMRQTSLALLTYAADFDGNFPEKLTDLIDEGYIDTDSILFAYERGKKDGMFLLRLGLTSHSPADEPMLLSPKTYMDGKRVVGFVDGRVQALSPAELIGIVEKFE